MIGWLEMSQNTTIGTSETGGYRQEACNDGGLRGVVAKYDPIAFCDRREEFIGSFIIFPRSGRF